MINYQTTLTHKMESVDNLFVPPVGDGLHQLHVLVTNDHPSGNVAGTYVNCLMWGERELVDLSAVSSKKWMGMRNSISASILNEKRSTIERERLYKSQVRKLSLALYEQLSVEKRMELLSKHPDSWVPSNAVCHGCLNICNDKQKCESARCGGMCGDCLEELKEGKGDVICKICGDNQKQVETCPICQEDKDRDQVMFAAGGCGHVVCKECFCESHQTSRPIYACPMCRGPFTGGTEVRIEIDDSEDEEFLTRLPEGGMVALLGEV